ncbi:hypothetical protein IV203_009312 [Nitzschia inconspicua]|uniref:Uncharacterized protein n=1 Tax=Nitzschia inconspicua TaxID=303405 RepID=A0A9K3PMZ4_9STRA|nr:hypothetical protein IV203_009312 [Nitzschia inconspicua]
MTSVKRNSPLKSDGNDDHLDRDSSSCCQVGKKRRVSDVSEKNTKTVTFADDSEIQEVLHNADVTTEDRKAMFMTDADQKRIFLDISKTIRYAKAFEQNQLNGVNSNPDAASTPVKIEGIRGLECMIQQRNSGRSKRMRNAVVAVLDRQLTDPIDESWLSTFYRPMLKESEILARKRAIRDEAEARAARSATRQARASISGGAAAAKTGCRPTKTRTKPRTVADNNRKSASHKRLPV